MVSGDILQKMLRMLWWITNLLDLPCHCVCPMSSKGYCFHPVTLSQRLGAPRTAGDRREWSRTDGVSAYSIWVGDIDQGRAPSTALPFYPQKLDTALWQASLPPSRSRSMCVGRDILIYALVLLYVSSLCSYVRIFRLFWCIYNHSSIRLVMHVYCFD